MELKDRVVLDTNCLLASLSSRSVYFSIWQGFRSGFFTFCVSNEIIEEYQEIIARKTNASIARNVVNAIVESEYVEFIDPQFKLRLITKDHDDDKFVDCAFAANATYIVSEDTHFDVLHTIPFPRILVLRINEFLNRLQQCAN